MRSTSLKHFPTKILRVNNVSVHLVGVNHVSRQSVEDVKTIIRSLNPDAVAVELDRDRAKMLLGPKLRGDHVGKRFSYNKNKQIDKPSWDTNIPMIYLTILQNHPPKNLDPRLNGKNIFSKTFRCYLRTCFWLREKRL